MLFLLILTKQILFCQDMFVPPKPNDLSSEKYEYYKDVLVQGYKSNNFYEVGRGLANLNASPDSVYKYLHKGLELSNPDELYLRKSLCYVFKTRGFKTVFVKTSLDKWNTYCFACNLLMTDEVFLKKQSEKTNQKLQDRIVLDKKKYNEKSVC